MTEQEAKMTVCAGLSRIYGMNEGIRMAGTVVPGIFNDFNQMAGNAAGGKTSEEYRLEDGNAVIFIAGRALADGTVSYDEIEFR